MNEDVASGFATRLLTDDVQPAQVVVCERKGWWAAVLRREWGSAGPSMRETRTLDDAGELLRRSPASFAIVELNLASLERVATWLIGWGRDFPLARAAVVAQPSLAACEGVMREAGAVLFTTSLRKAGPLADVAWRHVRLAPGPRWSLGQRVWAELPWGNDSQGPGPARMIDE